MRFCRTVGPIVAILCPCVLSVSSQEPCNAFDFGWSKSFLRSLVDGRTIAPTYKMQVDGHSALKSLSKDYETHLAGMLLRSGLADSNSRCWPPGETVTTLWKDGVDDWLTLNHVFPEVAMTLRLPILLAVSFLSVGPDNGPFGRFVGDVVAVFLSDGRRMQLNVDFAYISPRGKQWDAPKGSIVDGASIPQVFWAVVGGPFEGQYRNASVVHDVACVKKSEKWEDVHRMFYYAMRAGGVSEARAALMYAAVYKFGPRWDEPKGFWGKVFGVFIPKGPPPPPAAPPAPAADADVKTLEALIEQNKPTTPEEVERLITR